MCPDLQPEPQETRRMNKPTVRAASTVELPSNRSGVQPPLATQAECLISWKRRTSVWVQRPQCEPINPRIKLDEITTAVENAEKHAQLHMKFGHDATLTLRWSPMNHSEFQQLFERCLIDAFAGGNSRWVFRESVLEIVWTNGPLPSKVDETIYLSPHDLDKQPEEQTQGQDETNSNAEMISQSVLPEQLVGGIIQRLTEKTQAEIDVAMRPIVASINATLQSLVGKTFDAETAVSEIRRLKLLVARAGCQLHDETGRSVGIQPVPSSRAKNASIRVWTMIAGKRQTLQSGTAFPKLTALPLSE